MDNITVRSESHTIVLPVFLRRYSHYLFEYPGKIVLVAITKHIGHFINIHIGRPEIFAGLVHLQFQEKFYRGFFRIALEYGAEIAF